VSEPGIYQGAPDMATPTPELLTKTVYLTVTPMPLELGSPAWEQILADAHESGAFDFLAAEEEDIYSSDDGEPV
jgi:hypothetical protein